jgi:hypothetical protein
MNIGIALQTIGYLAHLDPAKVAKIAENFLKWNKPGEDIYNLIEAINAVMYHLYGHADQQASQHHINAPFDSFSHSHSVNENSNHDDSYEASTGIPVVDTPVEAPIEVPSAPIDNSTKAADKEVSFFTNVAESKALRAAKREAKKAKKTGFVSGTTALAVNLPRTEKELEEMQRLSPHPLTGKETLEELAKIQSLAAKKNTTGKESIKEIIENISNSCDISMPAMPETSTNKTYAAIAAVSKAPVEAAAPPSPKNVTLTKKDEFIRDFVAICRDHPDETPVMKIIHALDTDGIREKVDIKPYKLSINRDETGAFVNGKFCDEPHVVRTYPDPNNGDISIQEIGIRLINEVYRAMCKSDTKFVLTRNPVNDNGAPCQIAQKENGIYEIKATAHKSIFHLANTLANATYQGEKLSSFIPGYVVVDMFAYNANAIFQCDKIIPIMTETKKTFHKTVQAIHRDD